MTDESTTAWADLRAFLAADPSNRAALLKNPQQMSVVAADIAPTDAALRTALRAVVDSGAGGMLLGPDHPGPDAVRHIVQRVTQQGVSDEAATRGVRVLEMALYGRSSLPDLGPTPPPPPAHASRHQAPPVPQLPPPAKVARLWVTPGTPEPVQPVQRSTTSKVLLTVAAVAGAGILLLLLAPTGPVMYVVLIIGLPAVLRTIWKTN